MTISAIVFIVFAIYAKQTGYTMLYKMSQEHSIMYSGIINSYLEHTMVEHASEDSLSHFEHIFGETMSGPEVGTVFLLNNKGKVIINLTGVDSFQSVKSQVLNNVSSRQDSFTIINIEGLKSPFSVTAVENQELCHTCHNPFDDVRGYLGVSVRLDRLLDLASGHSNKNYMWMSIALILMSVSLIGLTYNMVIKPLKSLDQQMHDISLELEAPDNEWGLLSEIRTSGSKDEIGSLSMRVNMLLKRLNESTMSLKETHDQKILAADRLVTTAEMATSLAHEIKNPLAGIIGAIEIIYNKTDNNSEFKDTLGEVNRQLFRINHTLDDLLVFARPSKPTFALVDLHELLQSTLSILTTQPACEDIDFKYESSHEHQLINGDAKMIGQVLWNILTNAIQAMGSSGKLAIKLIQDESIIRLRVSDTGSGISEAEMDSIFNSFYTTKSKGTGLGLSVTKQILDLHYAQISLESEVGEGTTVSIDFLRPDEASS